MDEDEAAKGIFERRDDDDNEPECSSSSRGYSYRAERFASSCRVCVCTSATITAATCRLQRNRTARIRVSHFLPRLPHLARLVGRSPIGTPISESEKSRPGSDPRFQAKGTRGRQGQDLPQTCAGRSRWRRRWRRWVQEGVPRCRRWRRVQRRTRRQRKERPGDQAE